MRLLDLKPAQEMCDQHRLDSAGRLSTTLAVRLTYQVNTTEHPALCLKKARSVANPNAMAASRMTKLHTEAKRILQFITDLIALKLLIKQLGPAWRRRTWRYDRPGMQ
jgi:hypothetical protein